MDRTPFAGLTVVAPDESIYEDGASFLANNPRFIDYLLRLGAKTHRHDAHPPLPNPAAAPTVAVNTGGFLPASTTFHVGFTLVDADGGETAVSPIATITTPAAMPAATVPPGVAVASGSGLPIGTFYYAVTRTDGLGGETTLSPKVAVNLQTASKITLSGLNALRAGDAYSLVVYKSTGGAFYRVAETIADTWVDDGTPCADCTIEPPAVNTTQAAFLLDVAVPSAAAASATAVRIYGSQEASFISPSLVVELASGSLTTQMTRTQFLPGAPPPVSLSKGGANRINPDTDLIEWHWKRPVAASGQLPAGDPGDVRLVLTPTGPVPYAVGSASAAGPAGWSELVLFGPQGPQGVQGPVGAPGPALNPKGTYALASAYALYDNVDHQGSSYWASAATAAGTYPPLAPWVLVAEKGVRGPQGVPGMRWKGEWDVTLGYPLDSLVTYNNALWVAAGSAVAVGVQPGSAVVTFRGVEARPLLAFGSGFSDQVLAGEIIPLNVGGTDGGTAGHAFYFDVDGAGSTSIRAAPQPTHPTWDGYGLLYAATDLNTPIASDDSSAGNGMPLITATLPPGRYFYVLRGWSPGQYGYYHIDLTGSALFSQQFQGYWDRIFAAASAVASGGGGGLAGHIIASGATTYPQRAKLAFAGSGVTITDDAAGDRTVISFSIPAPASGSSSTPLSVVYGATTFTPRSKLKFTGTAVASVVDDPPNDQIVVTLVDTVGGGGASASAAASAASEPRGTVQTVTGSLASAAVETGTVALGVSSRIMRVEGTKACRVRLYTTAGKRTADAARAIGTDPVGDHGLALEVVLTTGVPGLDLAPQILASNMDTLPTNVMYYSILNMDAAGVITITYTRQRLEF